MPQALTVPHAWTVDSAGILEQSMGARNRVGIEVVIPAPKAALAGGIDSLYFLKVKKYLLSFLLLVPQ
jgi:hypothetical protein